MVDVSSADVQRNFGAYREIAAGGPVEPEAVTVMHDDKPSVVIISAVEYERLKQRDRQVALTEDLPEWLVEKIASAEMDPKFAALDEPG